MIALEIQSHAECPLHSPVCSHERRVHNSYGSLTYILLGWLIHSSVRLIISATSPVPLHQAHHHEHPDLAHPDVVSNRRLRHATSPLLGRILLLHSLTQPLAISTGGPASTGTYVNLESVGASSPDKKLFPDRNHHRRYISDGPGSGNLGIIMTCSSLVSQIVCHVWYVMGNHLSPPRPSCYEGSQYSQEGVEFPILLQTAEEHGPPDATRCSRSK
ncbi:hypothetical protein PIB30_031433 [Stylosanthes scabra]|uniref:Uncharacterized protein n=1 Tax=Stylosanthes scabra TaxID=79078 RepID=A0ABU6RCR8_9FABA|nr:hypothetical protein [Stylosanthes scabra]